MNAQLMDGPIQTTPQPVAPDSVARPRLWQAEAIAHDHATVGAAPRQMRRRLARRLLGLIGTTVSGSAIVVDSSGQWAIAMVEGVMFLLRGGDLVVVRRCTHCQTGRFESAPITNQDDLGYALATWQPYHGECAPTDPPDDASW